MRISDWSSDVCSSDLVYKNFVHAGAKLSDADKAKLKDLNKEESTLSTTFTNKLLAATKDAAPVIADKAKLAGLSDAELAAAGQAARDRKQDGKYVLTLQNTTQQPELQDLTDRDTRQALFEASWNRAEEGEANDTRKLIARIAQIGRESWREKGGRSSENTVVDASLKKK